MWEKGLTENTFEVFEKVSQLECIKDLYLCGGTGISLQIQNRLSEDLDFELLNYRGEYKNLNVAGILKEVSEVFPECKKEILGDKHIQCYVGDHVKLSFFQPVNRVPELNEGFRHNNLKTVSLQDSLGMKIFTTTVRNKFRDYYDIYSLLQEGCSLEKGITYALSFSKHQIKSKLLCSQLQMPDLFGKEVQFSLLKPKYDVDEKEIANYLTEKMTTVNIKKKKRGLGL